MRMIRLTTSLSMMLAVTLAASCSRAVDAPTPPVAAGAPLDSAAAPLVADPPSVGAIYRVPVDGFPAIGDASALVTIVAFTDYECPYCRKSEETLAKLRAKYGADLRVVVAAHPLPMHDRARPAALAALAALAQGRFDSMHARLMTGALDDAALTDAARAVGLDLGRFERDRRSGEVERALAHTDELAQKLGVRGTPTFFINGEKLIGNQPLATFESMVSERLAAARSLVASGVLGSRVYDRTIQNGLDHEVAESGNSCGEDDPRCDGDASDGTAAASDHVDLVPTSGAPSRGPAAAPTTIVVFSDFECPFCARSEATVRAVESAHPGAVRVVFKHMPLPFHAQARLAARAAIAAGNQGRFWEYHDALFAHRQAPDRVALETYARAVGLDLTRFERDLDDASLDAQIDSDVKDAKALGIEGTPTFFVNGHRIIGAQGAATFEEAIAKH